MSKQYYIYILRNKSGNFYIGITNDLVRRLWEHKNKLVKGYTEKYNIDRLIYYEVFNDPETAIAREKQLKNWNRKKKILLITKFNPRFEEVRFETLIW
ncbi:GIY-YIG nuclease family protein [Candidatus Daviesbacteria bacterium]|nr:GIY-YIG nuclease family protein [Candidatus Daviesbacteria bacterium]